ncbi:putative secreted protein [Brucella vulpis]|uniref:hypothetical protein n=1 Tax=Brucella vulpis TaxID=981386 RepID=UPI00073AA3CF|nr:putative secreted protein [Brucella vulpis]CUW51454.1 putative secreted protein [Brucella vulpis]
MKIHMKPMFRAAGCAVLFGALTVLAASGKEDEKAQEAAPQTADKPVDFFRRVLFLMILVFGCCD